MLGSLAANGRDRRLEGDVYEYGKQVECEICGQVRQCIDNYGLVTCQACQSELLPSSGVLYRG
jgi:hypothetical protein